MSGESSPVEWYRPGEITFTRKQIRDFILPNLFELREGLYPESHQGSCMTADRMHKDKADFEEACLIAGEIDARLELVGAGSQLLIDYYTVHRELGDEIKRRLMSRKWRLDVARMMRRINRMLYFISGRERPRLKYSEWRRQQKAESALKRSQRNHRYYERRKVRSFEVGVEAND